MDKKPFTHKPGSGAIFENRFKEGEQPDWKPGDGTVETTCPHCQAPFVVAFNIAGWDKITQYGNKMISFKIKDKLRDENFKKVGDHYTEYDSPPRPTQGQVYDEPVKHRPVTVDDLEVEPFSKQLTDEDLDDIVPF